MAYFKNSQECDQVLGNFFRKMAEGVAAKDPVLMEIQRKMAEMSLIVKFVWREPEMTLTLDFTKDPFASMQ